MAAYVLGRTQTIPGQSATAIRFEVLRRENGQDEWVANPAGIDAAISALFPDPIFIGAMENATEDVAKFGSGTTIGKLLKEIMAPVSGSRAPIAISLLVKNPDAKENGKICFHDIGDYLSQSEKLENNSKITVKDIPLEAYDYVVNGKPALDWVVERQCVKIDKASGIVNDANDWAIETMQNPKYPLELFLRVITVSLKP